MCRMWKGQTLVRTDDILEGPMTKGTVVTVARVIDENYIELEGFEGRFLRSKFVPSETYVAPYAEIGHMSDLKSVEMALRVINNWNRTHPTGLMISIEAYPAQDGGSLFTTPSFDSNDVSEFAGYLMDYASKEEKAEALERAAKALRFGV